MRGILIDPGCAPEIRKLPNTAQGLNAFLDLPLRQRLCGAGLRPPGATGYAQPALH